jgi:ferredoxin
MHHEITKRMFDAFPADRKSDFWAGYVSEVTDDCNGCGLCADDICHFDAISMDEAGERAVISQEKCMGCGNCADICPDRAIASRREPSKGDPLDLEELLSQP